MQKLHPDLTDAEDFNFKLQGRMNGLSCGGVKERRLAGDPAEGGEGIEAVAKGPENAASGRAALPVTVTFEGGGVEVGAGGTTSGRRRAWAESTPKKRTKFTLGGGTSAATRRRKSTGVNSRLVAPDAEGRFIR